MKAEPEAPVPEEREGFVAGCVQHRTGDLLAVLADVTARRLGGALALTRRFDAMAVDALQRMQQQLSKRGGPASVPVPPPSNAGMQGSAEQGAGGPAQHGLQPTEWRAVAAHVVPHGRGPAIECLRAREALAWEAKPAAGAVAGG